MAFPSSSPVSFPATTGTFTVDSVTSGGNPVGSVIDLDVGFQVSGTVSVPEWLPGSGTSKGQVCVYADELGGPVNQSIGCTEVDFSTVTTSDPPGLLTVNWVIPITKASSGLPDPQPNAAQLYHLAAVFTYGPQTTDIASFVDMGMFMIN